jgi:hypothetical protein
MKSPIYNPRHVIYRGRRIRYQENERVWVFNVKVDGKWERRVRNTLRAARDEIDRNKDQIATEVARQLRDVPIGRCRVCGCTDDNACVTNGTPCSWVDAEHTLCSACAYR